MSIETIASELSGDPTLAGFVVVKARKYGGFKSINDLVKTIKDPDCKAYAKAYYEWSQGGRKGAAPAAQGGSPKEWRFIRSAVHTIK